MKNNKEKLNVVQDEQDPIPAEILAKSIKAIADGFQRMKKAGLSDRAIVVLLADASGEARTTIKNVLWALDSLEKMYLKKRGGER